MIYVAIYTPMVVVPMMAMCDLINWKPRVVMMPTLSFMVAPQVVVITTCGATSDDKVVIMTILNCLVSYLDQFIPKISNIATQRNIYCTKISIDRRRCMSLIGRSARWEVAVSAIRRGSGGFDQLPVGLTGGDSVPPRPIHTPRALPNRDRLTGPHLSVTQLGTSVSPWSDI